MNGRGARCLHVDKREEKPVCLVSNSCSGLRDLGKRSYMYVCMCIHVCAVWCMCVSGVCVYTENKWNKKERLPLFSCLWWLVSLLDKLMSQGQLSQFLPFKGPSLWPPQLMPLYGTQLSQAQHPEFHRKLLDCNMLCLLCPMEWCSHGRSLWSPMAVLFLLPKTNKEHEPLESAQETVGTQ